MSISSSLERAKNKRYKSPKQCSMHVCRFRLFDDVSHLWGVKFRFIKALQLVKRNHTSHAIITNFIFLSKLHITYNSPLKRFYLFWFWFTILYHSQQILISYEWTNLFCHIHIIDLWLLLVNFMRETVTTIMKLNECRWLNISSPQKWINMNKSQIFFLLDTNQPNEIK